MAGIRSSGYLLFAPSTAVASGGGEMYSEDEFDESDIWGSPAEPRQVDPGARKTIPSPAANRRGGGKKESAADRVIGTSLPVNIPDWGKILGNGFNKSGSKKDGGSYYDEEDEVEQRPMIPPHELLSKSRGASFSVHEGVGRTLKGRDLSRVRNAIWAKTGFQD